MSSHLLRPALVPALAPLLSACTSPLTPMPRVHHTIDYVEFTVRDVAEAKRFFSEAFGWSFTDYGPDYAGIRRAEGGEVGGLRSDVPCSSGGPLVVLYSEDLEASEAAVERAGGRVVQPVFSFPGGRRFEFEDPSGNRLAVWTSPGG